MRGDEGVAMSFEHEARRSLFFVVAEQVPICFKAYRRDLVQLDKPKMRLVVWQHELRFHALGSTALSQPVKLEYQKKSNRRRDSLTQSALGLIGDASYLRNPRFLTPALPTLAR